VCPDHQKVPERVKEKNWFFQLKSFEEKLEKFYEENTEYCHPNYRFNEIKSFVQQ